MEQQDIFTYYNTNEGDKNNQLQSLSSQYINTNVSKQACTFFMSKIYDFINKSFNILNGRINNLNIALRYELKRVPESDTALGSSICNIIILNIEGIMKKAYKEQYTPYQIYGYLLITITHELSHLDQDIDYLRTHMDPHYNQFIEISNHANALKYIHDHYDELQSQLGTFHLVYDSLSQSADYKKNYVYYHKMRYIGQRIMAVINTITRQEVLNIQIDDRIRDITLYDTDDYFLHGKVNKIVIKENGYYVNTDFVLSYLRYMVTFRQIQSSIWFDGVVMNITTMKNDPIKFNPMVFLTYE